VYKMTRVEHLLTGFGGRGRRRGIIGTTVGLRTVSARVGRPA